MAKQRIGTFDFPTEAELLNARRNPDGVSEGALGFAFDTKNLFVCINAQAPTWELLFAPGAVTNADNLLDPGFFAQKNGDVLEFKGLVSSDNTVIITDDADRIDLSAPGTGGTIVGGESLGDEAIFVGTDATGTLLQFKGLNVLSPRVTVDPTDPSALLIDTAPQEPIVNTFINVPGPSNIDFGERGLISDSGGPSQKTLVLPDPANATFTGRRVGIAFPDGNPNDTIEVGVSVNTTRIFWPDGVVTLPGASRAFAPGEIEAGTYFQWQSLTAAETGNAPVYVVDGTSLPAPTPPPVTIPQWQQTLSGGPATARDGDNYTNGVMPTIQETFPDTPANVTKDQIHFYWPPGENADGAPAPSVDPTVNNTAAYTIPIYRAGIPVDGGGGQTLVASLALDAGIGYSAYVQIQLIVRQQAGLAVPNNNLRFFARYFIDTQTPGFIDDESNGATNQFALSFSSGTLDLTFIDSTVGANGTADVHGVATVCLARLPPPS